MSLYVCFVVDKGPLWNIKLTSHCQLPLCETPWSVHPFNSPLLGNLLGNTSAAQGLGGVKTIFWKKARPSEGSRCWRLACSLRYPGYGVSTPSIDSFMTNHTASKAPTAGIISLILRRWDWFCLSCFIFGSIVDFVLLVVFTCVYMCLLTFYSMLCYICFSPFNHAKSLRHFGQYMSGAFKQILFLGCAESRMNFEGEWLMICRVLAI